MSPLSPPQAVRDPAPFVTTSRGEPGIDVYRGCSVILMFIVHSARLVPQGRAQGVAQPLLDFLLWAEPYIAASFLLLVGYSLSLSFENARAAPAWRARMLRRAAWLYAIAVGLFLLEYGASLPDLLLSPGVLSAIALAIALLAGALSLGWTLPLAAGLTLGSVALVALVDGCGATVSGVNGGPGGAFPLVAFAAFGAFVRTWVRERGPRALDAALAASLAVLLVTLATGLPWTTRQISTYLDYDGQLAIVGIACGTPASPIRVSFWNHSAIGALGLGFPLLLSLWLFTRRPRLWMNGPLIAPLHLLGRHALAAYVAHLLALGLLAATGLGPPSSSHALVYAAALAGLAALGGGLLETLRSRRR